MTSFWLIRLGTGLALLVPMIPMRRLPSWTSLPMCLVTPILLCGEASASEPMLRIERLDKEATSHVVPAAKEIAELRQKVLENPTLRKPRSSLVHALVRAENWDEARKEALAWRKHDAYSLLAIRQLGDIETAMGDRERAIRTYSAIVELLPKDVEARRALATIQKQNGDLMGAKSQLERALAIRPDDRRTAFELADVEQRLGSTASAQDRFVQTIAAEDTHESLRYPAKQRLAQIYAEERSRALSAGNHSLAAEKTKAIQELSVRGGTENDIKVYLSWDSDRTDVDLWVTTPSREKIFYSHKQGKNGESLFDDVTSGYGPESFTAKSAAPGAYVILVNFFGGRGSFKEARGEVVVITNEGRPNEKKEVIPYRIFEEKETVTVAKVHVGGAS